MKNLQKTLEREDGYTEYAYTLFGIKTFTISEFNGVFEVVDWFRDNKYSSLNEAMSQIRCTMPKIIIKNQ